MIADEIRRTLAAMSDRYKRDTLNEVQFFAGLAKLDECADRVAVLEGAVVPAALRVTDADVKSGKVVRMLGSAPYARPWKPSK